MKQVLLLILFCCGVLHTLHAVSIGSTGPSASLQPKAFFPKTDTDNTLLGFAKFRNGITLETDLTGATDTPTTCTFNDLFPVSGDVNLGGCDLYVSRDLIMTNSARITNVGRIFAKGNAIIFEHDPSAYSFPVTGTYGSFSLKNTNSISTVNAINSVGWSNSDGYVATAGVSTAGKPGLRVFRFNGSTLVLAAAPITDVVTWNGLSWHPTTNYVATTNNGAAGLLNTLRIYLFTPPSTFTQSDTRSFLGTAAFSVAWNPAGTNLVIGKGFSDGTAELVAYSFSTVTGLLTQVATANLNPNRNPTTHGLSWAPTGAHIALGTDTTGGNEQLLVYAFGGSSLTLTASMGIGTRVNGVSWSPSNNYLAVGLAGGTQSLRIYKVNTGAGTLTEVQSARVGISRTINSVHWHRSGNYVAVSYNGATRPQMSVYYFDKNALTLTEIGSNLTAAATNDNNLDARFSNAGTYLLRGDAAARLVAYRLKTSFPWFFDTTTIALNSDAVINVPWHFRGACRIAGNGYTISFQNGAQFVVRPGSSLLLEDVDLKDIRTGSLQCWADNASISVRNSTLNLASNFTFSRGSLLFQDEVIVTGTNKFNYTSRAGSTIDQYTTLFFDRNTTFSYAPARANGTLLNFSDATSTLYLNGATFHSTRTGAILDTGTLVFDDSVTMSSEARSTSESLVLKDSLTMRVLGNGLVNLFGKVRYEL